jgi:hypothetical protein
VLVLAVYLGLLQLVDVWASRVADAGNDPEGDGGTADAGAKVDPGSKVSSGAP